MVWKEGRKEEGRKEDGRKERMSKIMAISKSGRFLLIYTSGEPLWSKLQAALLKNSS